MELRNGYHFYSAQLPYIHKYLHISFIFLCFLHDRHKELSSMHAFSSVLLPFSTYFFFSFLQASSPPSIMQVCAISLFHLPHLLLFYPLMCRPGPTELMTYFLSRSWGPTCHLDGRLHDQPSVPTHPAPR